MPVRQNRPRGNVRERMCASRSRSGGDTQDRARGERDGIAPTQMSALLGKRCARRGRWVACVEMCDTSVPGVESGAGKVWGHVGERDVRGDRGARMRGVWGGRGGGGGGGCVVEVYDAFDVCVEGGAGGGAGVRGSGFFGDG